MQTIQLIQTILDNYENNIIALALYLETIPEYEPKLEEYIKALDTAKKLIDDWDYLSLTDQEADAMEDERLESYIDEYILSELPELDRPYFDSVSWKRDAHMDGRGNSIASYDGEEYKQLYNGTTYFIYRIS